MLRIALTSWKTVFINGGFPPPSAAAEDHFRDERGRCRRQAGAQRRQDPEEVPLQGQDLPACLPRPSPRTAPPSQPPLHQPRLPQQPDLPVHGLPQPPPRLGEVEDDRVERPALAHHVQKRVAAAARGGGGRGGRKGMKLKSGAATANGSEYHN